MITQNQIPQLILYILNSIYDQLQVITHISHLFFLILSLFPLRPLPLLEPLNLLCLVLFVCQYLLSTTYHPGPLPLPSVNAANSNQSFLQLLLTQPTVQSTMLLHRVPALPTQLEYCVSISFVTPEPSPTKLACQLQLLYWLLSLVNAGVHTQETLSVPGLPASARSIFFIRHHGMVITSGSIQPIPQRLKKAQHSNTHSVRQSPWIICMLFTKSSILPFHIMPLSGPPPL